MKCLIYNRKMNKDENFFETLVSSTQTCVMLGEL